MTQVVMLLSMYLSKVVENLGELTKTLIQLRGESAMFLVEDINLLVFFSGI